MHFFVVFIVCFLSLTPFLKASDSSPTLSALSALPLEGAQSSPTGPANTAQSGTAGSSTMATPPQPVPPTPEAMVITPPPSSDTEVVQRAKNSPSPEAIETKGAKGASSQVKTETLIFPIPSGDTSQIVKNMPDIFLAPRLSQIIPLESPAGQVLVTDPKIADVQLPNNQTMYVYGRSTGSADIIVTSTTTKISYRYKVKVKADFNDMSNIIQSMITEKSVIVTPVPEGVLLQGTVSKPAQAEDIRLLAKQYIGSGTVINQLRVKGSSQVNLRVKNSRGPTNGC